VIVVLIYLSFCTLLLFEIKSTVVCCVVQQISVDNYIMLGDEEADGSCEGDSSEVVC